MRKFIDIGANLTDPQFRGVYRGKSKHTDDFDAMLNRAKELGVDKMLVTGSSLKESRQAIELAKGYPETLYTTVGIHPCSANTVPADFAAHYASLEALAKEGAAQGIVKAFGEFGLDYDRLHFAPRDKQLEVFMAQLEIANRVQLPLFLHSRAAAEDFAAALAKFPDLPTGAVHSFTGTPGEARKLLDMGLYIGINGCSLKTEQNLAVVKELPLDRLMLETDGPWCEIRPSHASHKYISKLPYPAAKPEKWAAGSMVRGRCEPCAIQSVAEVIAALKGLPVNEVADAAYFNSHKVFSI